VSPPLASKGYSSSLASIAARTARVCRAPDCCPSSSSSSCRCRRWFALCFFFFPILESRTWFGSFLFVVCQSSSSSCARHCEVNNCFVLVSRLDHRTHADEGFRKMMVMAKRSGSRLTQQRSIWGKGVLPALVGCFSPVSCDPWREGLYVQCFSRRVFSFSFLEWESR